MGFQTETTVKLEYGPYLDPTPTWDEIKRKGYRKVMDYFHPMFEIKPRSGSRSSGGLQLETTTTYTRVVVWLNDEGALIQAFGMERTLVKAVMPWQLGDLEPHLDEIQYDIQHTVEDSEREQERGW